MQTCSLLLVIIAGTNALAQVGIGTTTPKAALEINNTNEGLLIPRIALNFTSSLGINVFPETLATPTASELVYNTATTPGPEGVTPGFYYLNETATGWIRLATGIGANTVSGWLLTGNAGTSPGANFVGTTDVQPLRFRVNNKWSGQIDDISANTSFGVNAFNSSSSGTNNTANGAAAMQLITTGSNNTAFGANALKSNTTGNANTALGFEADVLIANLSNATAVGSGAIVNASNKVRIGNDLVVAADVAGQLKVNAQSSTNDFTLPTTRGTTGLVLSTNGLGATSWVSPAITSIVKVTAAYTVLDTDYIILANATTAGFTITLPAAAASTGRIIVIRKTDETPNTLTFSQSIRISETTSYTTLNINSTIRLQSDGTAWYQID